MSALQHQPLLFRELACAALEVRAASGGDVFDALDRVAIDFDRAGFPELAKALGGILREARGAAVDEAEELKEAREQIEELQKELEVVEKKLEKAVTAAGEVIRDAATKWVAENVGEKPDETADALKAHLDEEINDLDAEELAS